ncbi:MAG: hypothetical protein ACYTG0_32075 [Planctomycetota bacterium]|jgi:uncharacterized protein YqfA (UPF0365 family)
MDIQEFLSRISHDIVPVTAIVLGVTAGVVISITAIISGTVRRFRERKVTTNLIQDMLDRGMSTDEIERLVKLSATAIPDDD